MERVITVNYQASDTAGETYRRLAPNLFPHIPILTVVASPQERR